MGGEVPRWGRKEVAGLGSSFFFFFLLFFWKLLTKIIIFLYKIHYDSGEEELSEVKVEVAPCSLVGGKMPLGANHNIPGISE